MPLEQAYDPTSYNMEERFKDWKNYKIFDEVLQTEDLLKNTKVIPKRKIEGAEVILGNGIY